MEIAEETVEYCQEFLEADETKNFSNPELEVSKEFLLGVNKLPAGAACVVPTDAEGQVVPSRKPYKAEFNQEEYDCITVPPVKVEEKPLRSLPEAFDRLDENVLENNKCLQNQKLELNLTPVNIFKAEEEGSGMKKFKWPPLGIVDEDCKNYVDKEDLFQQFTFHGSCKRSQKQASLVPCNGDITNPEQKSDDPNTMVVDVEARRVRESKLQPLPILKRSSGVLKRKEMSVHFPEDIVSVRLYDISDDEDSDSDTIILSDLEENSVMDQQVPTSTFYGPWTSFQDQNQDHISTPLSLTASVVFKPQFTFPPAIRIDNQELFDSPNGEEQMMGNIEGEYEDNERAVGDLESKEIPHEYGELYGDQFTNIGDGVSTTESWSEIITSEEKPEVSHVEVCEGEEQSAIPGINEGLSENNCITCASMEVETTRGDDVDQTSSTNVASNCSCKPDDSNIAGSSKEHEIMEGKPFSGNSTPTSSDSPAVTSISDQKPYPGTCGSSLLWRGRRSIDTMLVDEISPIPTTNEDIQLQPTMILQAMSKENVLLYNEKIIDVVNYETNILKLSEMKVDSGFDLSQCDVRPKKYRIQSFMSSPEYWSNSDYTEQSSTDLKLLESGCEEKDEKIAMDDGIFVEKVFMKCQWDGERENLMLVDNPKCNRITAEENPDFHEDKAKDKPNVPDFGNRLKCFEPDLPSPEEMFLSKVPKDSQKPAQIVPEIGTRDAEVSRKQSATQTDEVHAVPAELGDLIDVNTPFHSDNLDFEDGNIPDAKAAVDLDSKCSTSADTDKYDRGFDTRLTEDQFYEKLKQGFLPYAVEIFEDLARQKNAPCSSSPSVQEKTEKLFVDEANNDFLEKERRNEMKHHPVFRPKANLGLNGSETCLPAKQGRKTLRVGLSKSTRVKPLHPYWSKSRIK